MKILLLFLYLLTLAFGLLLRALNLRHLKRHGETVPPEFAGAVDPEVLGRTSAYTLAQSRLGLVESLFGAALTLAFLFGGLLPLYDRWIASLSGSFVVAGLLFFLGLQLAQTFLDVPFSLYRNFVLEARFGFNVMSGRLWLADLVKSTLLALLLLGLLTAGALAIIQASPQRWRRWCRARSCSSSDLRPSARGWCSGCSRSWAWCRNGSFSACSRWLRWDWASAGARATRRRSPISRCSTVAPSS
jgi:STE24 endopeptidase